MEFKDILLVLITYPKATDASQIEESISFAVALDTKISAIACIVQVRAPSEHLGEGFVADLVASERKKSADVSAELSAAFETSAKAAGVFQENLTNECFTSDVPDFDNPRGAIKGSDNRPGDLRRPQLSMVC